MRIFSWTLLTLSLVLSVRGAADDHACSSDSPANDSTKSQVLFFGGYLSNQSQMDQWSQASGHNNAYNQQFTFTAMPDLAKYPDSSSQGAIDADLQIINKCVDYINGSSSKHPFILVGHSSGAAISNYIAAHVKDKSKIRLVDLDGAIPDASDSSYKGVQITCWTAQDTASKTYSRNADSILSRRCRNHQIYKQDSSPHCSDHDASDSDAKWCLHFSLVNAAAPTAGVNSGNWWKTGYNSLQPNLSWLKDFASSSSGAPSSSPGSH